MFSRLEIYVRQMLAEMGRFSRKHGRNGRSLVSDEVCLERFVSYAETEFRNRRESVRVLEK